MAQARRVEAWEHTADLKAAVINVWAKRPIEPERLNRYPRRRLAPRRPVEKMPARQSFNIFASAILKR